MDNQKAVQILSRLQKRQQKYLEGFLPYEKRYNACVSADCIISEFDKKMHRYYTSDKDLVDALELAITLLKQADEGVK